MTVYTDTLHSLGMAGRAAGLGICPAGIEVAPVYGDGQHVITVVATDDWGMGVSAQEARDDLRQSLCELYLLFRGQDRDTFGRNQQRIRDLILGWIGPEWAS